MLLTLFMAAVLAPAALLARPAALRAGEDEVPSLAAQAGSAQAPAALARLIELAIADGEAGTARAATEALCAFGPEGQLALERVLRSAATLPARSRALELCAARRRPEDRGLLVEVAASDAPAPLRLQAIDALATDRDALVLLEPLLRALDPKVQGKALRTLGRARVGAAVQRARELVAPEARVAPALKIAAIDVLRDDGGPDSIRRLVAVAGHELGEVRDFALKSLLVMDRGAVLVLLVPMLAPDAAATEALVALEVVTRVDVGSLPEVREAVRDALDHPDADVQAAAIRVAAELGDREAIPRLERALVALDPAVNAAAIAALTELRREDPAWRERLRRLVRAPRTSVRLAAVRALATAADAAESALLLQLLDDESWRIREAAADGLAELRLREAIEPLIARLEGERMRVRGAFVRALRRTTGMPFQDNARDWRRWWADVREGFVVPPLAQVEAMELRLARNVASASTRARFYGIPVDSDHLALVIDVSGSMAELDGSTRDPAITAPGESDGPTTRLDVAKREVEALLERLPEGAALNLIFFNDSVQRWQRGLVPMSRAHAARACSFTRERRAAGATNLFDALVDALADAQIDTIYLLSDGNPTAGRIVDPIALRTEIRRRNASRNVRIHVVSIGHESPLLQHLAADSGGSYVQR